MRTDVFSTIFSFKIGGSPLSNQGKLISMHSRDPLEYRYQISLKSVKFPRRSMGTTNLHKIVISGDPICSITSRVELNTSGAYAYILTKFNRNQCSGLGEI